ncbi:MAG TPA: Rieske 2Fe-2S domain-containing protein [Jatrophihabitans sp.]|nr:Rieske 2Fe-2S domain-containing protein [Jatrophihabitans sp.]
MTALSALTDRLVERIERATVLDAVAGPVADLIGKALRFKPIRDLASGTPTGHPAHPPLVAVPIGSFVAASVLDLSGPDGAVAARRLIGLGVLSALPAAATGASDWSYTSGAERRLGFVHAGVNALALSCYTGSWVARRRNQWLLGALLAGGGATLLTAGGFLGGHLVYARGVGVDTTAFSVASEDWQDTLAEAELIDNQPTLVHAAGLPVLLIRRGGELFALDDRCSHRGGPLHEGQLSGDGCISCPWHGSRFRLAGGEVVDGPAVRPQRRWEVRTRYGMVQVRVPDEVGSLRSNPVS